MGPQEVYLQRTEFTEFAYNNFRSNLRYLRKDIISTRAQDVSDSTALANDRRIHPKKALNHRGEPRWEGSEAERLLRLDMDEEKHRTLKPRELYMTRQQYHDNYPLKVFRGHIDQEERRRKYIVYLKKKQAEKELA
jgi:hypothetical protein